MGVLAKSLVCPRSLNVCFKDVSANATAGSHMELPCLAQVTPTGYGGERVVERDVLAYLSALPEVTPRRAAAGDCGRAGLASIDW